MTIQELADRADVTTRTIRYYVDQGVLPPPERGRPAEYTEEHVARLALIKRLKEQYLPLEEIRDILQFARPDEVERLAQMQTAQEETRHNLSSAADYISGVLQRGEVREELKRKAAAPTPAQAPSPPAPGAMLAPQYGPLPTRRREPEGATAQPNRAYVQPPSHEVVEERAAPHESFAGPPQAATWERVDLGEGVELHYPAGVSAYTKGKIAQLVDVAQHILGKAPENGE
jgi:DNA-binding transcriptional MerR regulator